MGLGACPARRVNNFFCGLFHDLPELLTRDIISPVKKSFEDLETLIKEYENTELDRRVFRASPRCRVCRPSPAFPACRRRLRLRAAPASPSMAWARSSRMTPPRFRRSASPRSACRRCRVCRSKGSHKKAPHLRGFLLFRPGAARPWRVRKAHRVPRR